jgi:hypothetical protein
MASIKSIVAKAAGYVLLIGLLFGVFVSITVPLEMMRMASAESWPARKAIITTSYASRKSTSNRPPFWRPEICGNYQESGERFCVTRVSFGTFRFGSGEAEARTIVAKYPVGVETDVYQSPENPKETILDPHPSWNAMWTLLSVGVLFLVIPPMLWIARRHGWLPADPVT